MSKYVIKNCPAIATGWKDKGYICNTHQMGCGHCEDCTDCLLKQIVEKCKRIKTFHNSGTSNYPESDYSLGRITTAEDVLELLDISEVEE